MKHPHSIFTALLLLAVSTFAAEKAALSGESSLTGFADAMLRNDSAFDLLSRAEADEILRNYRLGSPLSRWAGRISLFAVADLNNITVFNAKNGFRLTDAPHSGRAEVLCSELRRAAQKSRAANPLYAATVSIRDAGIRGVRWRTETAANEVERKLLNDPRIQMPDRALLSGGEGKVLTGMEFAAKTGVTYFLMFEFLPGKQEHTIELHVRVRHKSGRKAGSFTMAVPVGDLFGLSSRCADKIRTILIEDEEQNRE